MLLAGVVDQHVKPAPAGDDRLDQPFGMARIAEVARREQHFGTFGLA